MRSNKTFPRTLALFGLILTLSVVSVAKGHENSFPNIKISNFGQMDENFYRGARPKDKDYPALKELGI